MSQTHGTWGTRVRVFQNDTCLVTILRLVGGKRCSYHLHKTAYNLFYVVEGQLTVVTERGYSTLVQEGDVPFVVEPGILHEFQTEEGNVVLLEIAYVQYEPEDIQREKAGGDIDEVGPDEHWIDGDGNEHIGELPAVAQLGTEIGAEELERLHGLKRCPGYFQPMNPVCMQCDIRGACCTREKPPKEERDDTQESEG